MSDEFRDSAKSDSDLEPIRDPPAFKQPISDADTAMTPEVTIVPANEAS